MSVARPDRVKLAGIESAAGRLDVSCIERGETARYVAARREHEPEQPVQPLRRKALGSAPMPLVDDQTLTQRGSAAARSPRATKTIAILRGARRRSRYTAPASARAPEPRPAPRRVTEPEVMAPVAGLERHGAAAAAYGASSTGRRPRGRN